MRTWLLSGPMEHWRIGVPNHSWGVKEDSHAKVSCYDKLSRGDVVYFYATKVKALVGVGLVTGWGKRTIELRKSDVYPYRIFFDSLIFLDDHPTYPTISMDGIGYACAASINAISPEADRILRERIREQWNLSLPETTAAAEARLRGRTFWSRYMKPVLRWALSRVSIGN